MLQNNLTQEQAREMHYDFGVVCYNVSRNYAQRQNVEYIHEALRYLSLAEENLRKALECAPEDEDITEKLRVIGEDKKGLREKLKESLKTNHLPAQCK